MISDRDLRGALSAADEDFAQSALQAGLAYPRLIEQIIRLGMNAVRE